MYASRIVANARAIAASPGTRFRALHSSSRVFLANKTKGQAPDSSREPKEHTLLEQNPHLKHAASSQGGKAGRDTGKGNAAPEPELPSKQQLEPSSDSARTPRAAKGTGNKKRSFHTSAIVRSGTGSEHTAEDYFKDIDKNPPSSDKTFRVDGTSEAMYRPNQQWADPQKEYATVSKDEPYEPRVERNSGEKPEQKDQKPRYGNVNRDPLRNAPKGEEGPQGKDAGGLKTSSEVGT